METTPTKEAFEQAYAIIAKPLSTVNASLKEQLESLGTENEDLKSKLSDSVSINASLKEQLGSLGNENEGLKSKLADSDPTNASVKEQLESLGTENEDLKSKLSDSDSINASLKEQLESLGNENEGLKSKLADSDSINASLKEQLESLKTQLADSDSNNTAVIVKRLVCSFNVSPYTLTPVYTCNLYNLFIQDRFSVFEEKLDTIMRLSDNKVNVDTLNKESSGTESDTTEDADIKTKSKKARTTDSVVVLSVNSQGRGFSVTYNKNGGGYMFTSLTNFHSEYPQFIYNKKIINFFKKKAENATESKLKTILDAILTANNALQ